MSDYFRVIFTGSQEWDDETAPHRVLEMYAHHAFDLGLTLLAVHGKAHRGLDSIIWRWVLKHQRIGWPVAQETHPTDWYVPCTDRCRPLSGHRRVKNGREWCPAAGQYRNEHMISAGARACEAFIRDYSHGASRTYELARKAGIPTHATLWDERERPWEGIAVAVGPPLRGRQAKARR